MEQKMNTPWVQVLLYSAQKAASFYRRFWPNSEILWYAFTCRDVHGMSVQPDPGHIPSRDRPGRFSCTKLQTQSRKGSSITPWR